MKFFSRRLPTAVLAGVVALTLGVGAVVTGLAVLPNLTAEASADRSDSMPAEAAASVSTAGFDEGLIISDYNFFNPNAMTEAEVQSFLEGQDCRPVDDSPCLADYRESTVTQPDQGAGHCAPYAGARSEPASRIIERVAEACTVSPRVLLVLLQKEQSLLTRPSASGYLRATGYGCPDTADCATEYFGFFNQVYNAAWQFRQYTQEPDRTYQLGAVPVQFNPNADCGAATVQIDNQATANLYNYTPYQPNGSALANPFDEGNDCSAYGNLNFWLFYSQWFGDPQAEPYSAAFDDCLKLVGGQPCRVPDLPSRP
jgi:hypothetical protein